MNAIAIQPRIESRPVIQTTLLELVRALSEVTRDETELVCAVLDLLESGRAKLTGNMRDIPVAVFRSARHAQN